MISAPKMEPEAPEVPKRKRGRPKKVAAEGEELMPAVETAADGEEPKPPPKKVSKKGTGKGDTVAPVDVSVADDSSSDSNSDSSSPSD